MTVAFDRLAFVRAMRGKPGIPPETLEALADALHAQYTARPPAPAPVAIWETPRNVGLTAAATAIIAAVVGGWVGYGLSSRPAQVIQLPPGSTITVPGR